MTMPDSKTFPRLVKELAGRYPDREAIVAGDVRLTYGGLQDAVFQTARGLYSVGVQRGDKVAILLGNRAEWIVSALAITSLGAVAVAVNTWLTTRELAYVLEHSEAKAVITVPTYLKSDYRSMLTELQTSNALPNLTTIISVGEAEHPKSWVAFEGLAALGHSVPPEVITAAFAAVQPDDVAYLVYTSGSTSAPKGVQLIHRGLIENTWRIGERQRATHDDRVWLAVSLFWGFGCSNAMPNLLTHGGCIVLQESFDAGRAIELIERERCTLFYGTPNMAQAMHEHPDRPRHDLSSLRSGATLGTAQQIMRVIDLGAREICNVYGLSEIYGNCHATSCDEPLERRLNSVGQPLEGVSQRIVDPSTETECPPGEVGEIRVKGYVTPGYYKDPETTAKSFDDQGYFRTGDLGFVDADGYLYFRGRLKEVVKTGGILVSPAEVEAALMSHPGVQLALVVGVPDPHRDEVLAAVIVPRPGNLPSEAELVALCKDQLAAYKVPRRFTFSPECDLPLTTTGKVQKNKLAGRFFAA
jgi:fatty-acyl-CoA synthase